jgi:hypothetical protein
MRRTAVTLSGAEQGTAGAMTYYSLVTLTTLDYGDIVPVSDYARTFSFLGAMTGTLYVAILISLLVSTVIAHSL